MAKRDRVFKLFLLHHAHEVIAAELGLQAEPWEPTETEPSSPPRERRLDKVFRVLSLRRYIHYEVQNTPDHTMAHRMHEYGVRQM